MKTVPPNAEWERVERGKQVPPLRRNFVTRTTLVVVLQVLVLTVKLARAIQKFFDGA